MDTKPSKAFLLGILVYVLVLTNFESVTSFFFVGKKEISQEVSLNKKSSCTVSTMDKQTVSEVFRYYTDAEIDNDFIDDKFSPKNWYNRTHVENNDKKNEIYSNLLRNGGKINELMKGYSTLFAKIESLESEIDVLKDIVASLKIAKEDKVIFDNDNLSLPFDLLSSPPFAEKDLLENLSPSSKPSSGISFSVEVLETTTEPPIPKEYAKTLEKNTSITDEISILEMAPYDPSLDWTPAMQKRYDWLKLQQSVVYP